MLICMCMYMYVYNIELYISDSMLCIINEIGINFGKRCLYFTKNILFITVENAM